MKKTMTALAAAALALTLVACGNSKVDERNAAQEAKKSATKNSLEKANLSERIKRQERPTAIGYVYVLSFGEPFGYYVIKGKVSNSGSQLTPEQDVITHSYGNLAVDGPQDDGTYGAGDPGIFFFTSQGTMVETSLDYIYSDQPLDLDVKLLAK